MTDFIITLHAYNPYLLITAATVAGIWGLILYFARKENNRAWRTTLIVVAALGILQALLGIILLVMGFKPGKPHDSIYYLHYVYGAIVALGLPIGITYATGGKNPRRDLWIYSAAALIVAAAAVRGLMTGPSH